MDKKEQQSAVFSSINTHNLDKDGTVLTKSTGRLGIEIKLVAVEGWR
jgi:hypothetical protein